MSVFSTIMPADVEVATSPSGFLRGTRLMSPAGWRAIEDLMPGDVLQCCKGHEVRVTGRRVRMLLGTDAKVVSVSGEARGAGRRADSLLLAPDQMIVVAGDRLAACFGVEEALAPIGALVNGGDLRLVDAPLSELWIEIETDEPCALVVEGLQVALGDAARDTRPALSVVDARLLALAA
jgi:hypothetical protein